MWEFFSSFDNWIGVAEVLIIVFSVWIFYNRFIKGTGSEKLVHGLIGLGLMWAGSWILLRADLDILGMFLRWVSMFLSVGLIVIFGPELRKFLAMLGHVRFLRALFIPNAIKNASEKEKAIHATSEIIKAIEYMSANHTGALIVLKNEPDVIKRPGIKIDAEVSSELLLTIFFNKTPLHDGAVIIDNNRIFSAGAILPLSDKGDLGWKYGTRHRAAIGMSEQSDVTVLVVSEETGDISIAKGGVIKKIEDMKKLRTRVLAALTE